MTEEKLKRANTLKKNIAEFKEALNCFEYEWGPNNIVYDRTPKIILDVDDIDGGREKIPIPMILSDEIIKTLKIEIRKKLSEYEKEFSEL